MGSCGNVMVSDSGRPNFFFSGIIVGFMVCAPGWLIGSVPGSRTLGWLWDFYQRVWDFCVAFWECVGLLLCLLLVDPKQQDGDPWFLN